MVLNRDCEKMLKFREFTTCTVGWGSLIFELGEGNSESDKFKVDSFVQDVSLVLSPSMTASSPTKHVSIGTPLRAKMLRDAIGETLFMQT